MRLTSQITLLQFPLLPEHKKGFAATCWTDRCVDSS